jgi:hypothetical protein
LAFKKLLIPSLIGLTIGVIIGVFGEIGLIGRSSIGASGMAAIAIFAIVTRLKTGIQSYSSPTFFFIIGMMSGVVAADFAMKTAIFALAGTIFLTFRA